MPHQPSAPIIRVAFLTAGALVGFILAGCFTPGSGRSRSYQSPSTGRIQTAVGFEDDYDYYPGYEVYYSRNRREYVYRHGNAWVRRPEPMGVSLNVLLASPSVRVDFRDSPERHHDTVIRSYPKTWRPQPRATDGKPDFKDDRRNDQPDHRPTNERDRDDRKDSDERHPDEHKQD